MSVENLTLAITLLLLAERILRAVAPMTATTIDDEAVKGIDKAREWARTMAPAIYAVVEQLAASGKIAKAEKAQVFLNHLEEAYHRVEGAPLPAQAHAEAEIVAKGLAAADKLTPSATLVQPTIEHITSGLVETVRQNPPAAPSN